MPTDATYNPAHTYINNVDLRDYDGNLAQTNRVYARVFINPNYFYRYYGCDITNPALCAGVYDNLTTVGFSSVKHRYSTTFACSTTVVSTRLGNFYIFTVNGGYYEEAPSGYTHTVNGIAAASIASINGVATANIAKVNEV